MMEMTAMVVSSNEMLELLYMVVYQPYSEYSEGDCIFCVPGIPTLAHDTMPTYHTEPRRDS
jgi:hypothetical protein